MPKKSRHDRQDGILDRQQGILATDPSWTPSLQEDSSLTPRTFPCLPSDLPAPRKKLKPKRRLRSKRALFEDCSMEVLIKEITGLIPSVLQNLKDAEKHVEFCVFLRQIVLKKFPLHNIAFLLLLDVAKWYSLKTTTQMKYPAESMEFWKIMYRLFHGKALRFMSGIKSYGHASKGEENIGHYDPQNTHINFAVPSIQSVINYESISKQIPKEIKPGIIEEGIELQCSGKSHVLSVDGKKLAPGLNDSNGDQDLFGHEENESLEMTNERLCQETSIINRVKEEWSALSDQEKCKQIETVLKTVSSRIADMRKLIVKQMFALKKFYNEAGNDWRSSKFVYAISSIQAHIYQIRAVIQKMLQVNDSLLEIGSRLKAKTLSYTFTADGVVDMYSQENWVSLKDVQDLPPSLSENARFIKQRSESWFANRKKYVLTGSTLYNALGLASLKEQQRHFDKVIGRKTEEAISQEVQRRLDHGTESEPHAVGTLTSKVLPFYYSELKYVEEGALITRSEPKIMVSPDGSLCQMENNTADIPLPMLGCEFKCPFPADYKTPVHYEIPLRYIPQLLAEMVSLEVNHILYLCWTEESSTVFRATFDHQLWQMIEEEASLVYGGEKPKRPTRLSLSSKEIVKQLCDYRESKTQFLCEMKSVKVKYNGASQTNNSSPYIFPVVTLSEQRPECDVELVINAAALAIEEVHQLCRKKATEVLVWLLSDTDRVWDPEIPHSTPVAYAMKGYSLPVQQMRAMHDHVLQRCYEKNIDVVCSTFDGQWLGLATRDEANKPLTLLQLQRDVYEQSSKTSRQKIVSELQEPFDSLLEKKYVRDGKAIIISSLILRKIMKSAHHKVSCHIKSADERNHAVSDTMACLPNEALESLIISDSEDGINIITASTEDNGIDVAETALQDSSVVQDDMSNVANEQPRRTDHVNEIVFETILKEFQSCNQKSVLKRWEGKSSDSVRCCIYDVEKLQKLSHRELNIILDNTREYQEKSGQFVRKSWNIIQKVNGLSSIFGCGFQIYKEKTVRELKPLKALAAQCVLGNRKHVPKRILNNIYAITQFSAAYKKWLSCSPFNEEMEITECEKTKLFSFPARSDQRKRLEPKCVDYHHLLVNLRVKVCKDGVHGIRKDAWHAVAEKDSNIISRAIVCDLIDKQNNAFAKKTFSIPVEEQMRKLNFNREAEFCKIIREWYEAEDTPGIPAVERVTRRLNLKNFLLKGVDFGMFPPPGMYIKGFPKVMFEAFLQRIDTTVQLYKVIKSGAYNSRAISSLVNETFFGELAELEPTKLGCPKAISIPRLISTVTEIQHFRCNPTSRNFKVITTSKSVYPQHALMSPVASESHVLVEAQYPDTAVIQIRDHVFDTHVKKRKQRHSKRRDVSKPDRVARGCQPVRAFHKCDESKILPTTRLGIDMKSY